jgi:hypothetical protein
MICLSNLCRHPKPSRKRMASENVHANMFSGAPKRCISPYKLARTGLKQACASAMHAFALSRRTAGRAHVKARSAVENRHMPPALPPTDQADRKTPESRAMKKYEIDFLTMWN